MATYNKLPPDSHRNEEDPAIFKKDPPQSIPILHAQVVYDVLRCSGPSTGASDGEGRLGDERQLVKVDLHEMHPLHLGS